MMQAFNNAITATEDARKPPEQRRSEYLPNRMTQADYPGLEAVGNIDLSARPVVKNEDGSISTVRSISVDFDDGAYLLPTVSPDGKILSNEDAIALFKATGQHLGKFKRWQDADAYAQRLHEDQAREYLPAQ